MKETSIHEGYTLIEMIVSISIMVLMIAIVGGTYSFGKRHDTLKSETERLGSALRAARNRALSGVPFVSSDFKCSLDSTTNCTTNQNCAPAKGHCTNSKYPTGGYGVHIYQSGPPPDNGKIVYELFGDVSGSTNPPKYDSTTERVQKFTMASSIKFLGNGGIDLTEFELMFNTASLALYHKPTSVWQTPSFASGSTYRITLQHGNDCSVVKKKGLVEIDTKSGKIVECFVDCSTVSCP